MWVCEVVGEWSGKAGGNIKTDKNTHGLRSIYLLCLFLHSVHILLHQRPDINTAAVHLKGFCKLHPGETKKKAQERVMEIIRHFQKGKRQKELRSRKQLPIYTSHYTICLSKGWDYQSVFVSRLICTV